MMPCGEPCHAHSQTRPVAIFDAPILELARHDLPFTIRDKGQLVVDGAGLVAAMMTAPMWNGWETRAKSTSAMNRCVL
jgi:hypothetical protein